MFKCPICKQAISFEGVSSRETVRILMGVKSMGELLSAFFCCSLIGMFIDGKIKRPATLEKFTEEDITEIEKFLELPTGMLLKKWKEEENG